MKKPRNLRPLQEVMTRRVKSGRGKDGQKKIRQKAQELEKKILKLNMRLKMAQSQLSVLRSRCNHPSKQPLGCATSKTKPVFGWICYDCGDYSDPLIE